MTDKELQQTLASINNKLDYVLEEIEHQKRHRREMDDLKDDLTRVGNDVFKSAVLELEEVHDHIQTGDILYLFKKLLRNIKNLTGMFEQLENINDFLKDFSPVFRDLVRDQMSKLDAFDRKGYFEFFKELSNIIDIVVTSYSKEDIQKLGENIVTMLNIVKDVTQPEMLNTVNNALNVYKNMDVDISDDISMYSLVKELRTPEMKRGFAFAIKLLQNLASGNTADNHSNKNMVKIN
ncbi:hypothetical protein ACFL6O_01525 [candidate division KSB1 bacterium]